MSRDTADNLMAPSHAASLRWRARWWLSPADQPPWARPALLALSALAALAYCWHLGSSTEIFYAAADRSMASNWHDFFFAAFDPAGTISIDKLPGAFWLQALSVRLFGAHTWVVALPQAIEGVLSVLVLYRAVRRCAGPASGIVAAGILAISPATVALDRGNVEDSLLILLMLLAANSLVTAIVTGRLVHLVAAGIWVGLAFQAKMLEAWLVVPALLVAYIVAGGGSSLRRLAWATAMVAVVLVVSFGWMTAVSLTPHNERPYLDGTTNDSIVSQVFDYNGIGRAGHLTPNQVMGRSLGIGFLAAPSPPASLERLLEGSAGRDIGWLLPGAVLSIPVLLWETRRRSRADPLRAGVLLWGIWLVCFAAVFSVSPINSYYLGALSPPIAALLAMVARLIWERRRVRSAQLAAAGLVLITVAYAVLLLPASGTGLPPWLAGVTVGLGALALGSLVAFAVTRGRWAGSLASLCAAAAILVVPCVASVSVVTNELGPFDTPFQPTSVTSSNRIFFGNPLQATKTLPAIERVRAGAPDLMATETSVLAAPFIFATGQEVLPIGGYDGVTPHPSLGAIRAAIARGQFHLVLTAAHSHDPRALWIRAHCIAVPSKSSLALLAIDISYCLPKDASEPTRQPGG